MKSCKLFLILLAAIYCLTSSSLIAGDKPNIVVILADDLGIECLSTYGGTSHQTPNIDKLASQGMRFTNCFSNPYFSPSRASLLSGRYPFKNGLKQVIFDSKKHANTYLHTDQFARKIKTAIEQGTAGDGRGFVLMPSSCPYGRKLPPLALKNYRKMVEMVNA